LEGPYINSKACGAHPCGSLRNFKFSELEKLWSASQETLKIITLAPELLTLTDLKKLCNWSRARKIVLSVGHSQATESEALRAFNAGFRGVTHAWNALPFHQRQPGVLGAAVEKQDVYLEMIIDQVHVSPTLIRWTRELHKHQSICFISDCIPSGGFAKNARSPWCSFGNLRVHFKDGASRLANGQLAGGGFLLSDSYCRWVQAEALRQEQDLYQTLKTSVHHITQVPCQILGIPPQSQADRQVIWKIRNSEQIDVIPVDSSSGSR
jgi:N-acetylglucosamine-6-phosphate deacetylase